MDIEVIKISFINILINIVLFILKFFVGLFTGSISVLLDGVNNLSNSLNSIISMFETNVLNRKSKYKNIRIKYFIYLTISFLMLMAGLSSLRETFKNILMPSDIKYSFISIIVILLSIILKYYFGDNIRKKSKDKKSNILSTIAEESINDSILSFLTLISALSVILFKYNIDGYVGIFISIFILKTAFDLLKNTINNMIGKKVDSNLEKEIKKYILSYDEIIDIKDLSIYNYGSNKIISTTYIKVKDNMNAKKISNIIKRISMDILDKYNIDITISIYTDSNDKTYNDINSYLNKIILDYKTILEVNNLYLDDEKNNIYFNILFNDSENNHDKVIDEINEIITKKYPKYNIIITYDIDII